MYTDKLTYTLEPIARAIAKLEKADRYYARGIIGNLEQERTCVLVELVQELEAARVGE